MKQIDAGTNPFAMDAAPTPREMRQQLFHQYQDHPASKYYPEHAEKGETVAQMRQRLFKVEPQDEPYKR